MSGAARQRLRRARRRSGLVVLDVEASKFEISEHLVEAGFLDPLDCENNSAIAAALECYLRALCTYE